MVSSWAENPPTATTHRCTGSSTSSDPARKYADPASLKNPYASSSRVNPATVLTQNVIRDAQFWAHQAFHPATHHIIMTRSSQLGLAITAGGGTATSHAAGPHTSPRLRGGETHRRRYASPDPSTAPFSAATCRRAAQHLSNELAEHSRAPQPTTDERSPVTDGQITHLAPSRCSMTAWAAAKRAIGTRNGEQET